MLFSTLQTQLLVVTLSGCLGNYQMVYKSDLLFVKCPSLWLVVVKQTEEQCWGCLFNIFLGHVWQAVDLLACASLFPRMKTTPTPKHSHKKHLFVLPSRHWTNKKPLSPHCPPLPPSLQNLARLVTLQSRTKKLQKVSEGSYQALSTSEAIETSFQSKMERVHSASAILHCVCQEFPQHQEALRRPMVALAARKQALEKKASWEWGRGSEHGSEYRRKVETIQTEDKIRDELKN